MGADLPGGTVTFLFTDVEGSTRLLRELGPQRYAEALAMHRRAIRDACARHDGVEVDTQGDAFFVVFPAASGAVRAAQELTEALAGGPIRVRAGIHTGEALVTPEGYVGEDVSVAARVAASAHAGQVVLTRATAALVDVGLTDLGEHRLRDIDGAIGILQLGEGTFPPLTTASSTNLPRPASSFVGRDRELAAVLACIERGARLVTLTGPGGSGKTRLAIEAAASLVPSFRAGVFWVDLAALRDPALVGETVAATLGARNGLPQHIGDRELLLLVDNFEQVIDAAAELGSLVVACPNLVVLVTSRELLRVDGEVEYPVPPMDEAEAVALFGARARLDPTPEVAELCRHLDSLPLAVELAAARATALSPAGILERFEQRLDLLRGGRDADPRQQTLRATIDWSYDLLSGPERRLFRCLSVFVRGATLEAAEEVCDAELDTLQSLVEKSLVRFSADRYAMLETIREYARERLEGGETAVLARRHRAWVVRLSEESAPRLHTAEEAATSAALAPEYANVRAAVTGALAAEEPDDAGRILGAIYPFLISHGHLAEVLEWGEATLAMRDRLSERGLAETLVGTSEVARFAGDLGRAAELKEELARMHVELQRPRWRAAILGDLSEIALDRGDVDAARRHAEAAAEAGDPTRAALCLAELSLRTGELAAAETAGTRALEGMAEGSFNHATCLELLGEAARRAGDDAVAAERFSDALREFEALADAGGMADAFDGLARLAGGGERAGRLHGSARNLRETSGRRPIRDDAPPPVVPAAALEAGAALSLDEALDEALHPPA